MRQNRSMISIIIPTLNEEVIIKETLTRLIGKIDTPHEVIVSDGGSSDQTVEIARALGVKVLEHRTPNRQTIAEGRNAGAAEATGDILIFLDADCEIKNSKKFFNTIIENFKQNSTLVAMTPAIWVDPKVATWTDRLVYAIVNTLPGAPGECQIVRQTAFNQVGGYNKKLVGAEDYELFQRLGRAGKVKFDGRLEVHHTGRRAHKIGWPVLLFQWAKNFLSMKLSGKSASKEWPIIR